MQQYSTDDLSIELEILSGDLLFIDPLYFQDIVNDCDNFSAFATSDRRELIKLLEEKFFPYSGGSLLGYKSIDKKAITYRFVTSELKKWNTNSLEKALAQEKLITTFVVDTASFLIIDLDNFEQLLKLLTYDDLVDAFLSHRLKNYFKTINSGLKNQGWAYLVSNASDTNNDFVGDGAYIVH